MKTVENITIVGGGTSAWLTAAYIYHNCPQISITVVDKEVGNPIGVGEGTILNFKPFMDDCGFDVNEWQPAIDATYKCGILFDNWTESGNQVWHPFYKGNRMISFGNQMLPRNFRIHDMWTIRQDLDFKKYGLPYYESAINENKVDTNNLDQHAFQVDCGKLVAYVQSKLKGRIKLIQSDVIKVNTVDNNVLSLELKNGDIIVSDLFVDCTGFKNILRTPKKKVDLKERLFCDTAAVIQLPYENRDKELTPYTRCEAVDHGWIWTIPTASRIGTGLVFNRNITDPEEAKDYLANYWKGRVDRDRIRIIDWTPYYHEDPWEGNVVSIGLSCGFIEPLESTGIALISAGIIQLGSLIRENFYDQDMIDFFNIQMKMNFEDCVDFVNMHYANNKRTTKFWNWVNKVFKPSTKMLFYKNQLARNNINTPFDGKFNTMFNGANWTIIMTQMGFEVAPRNVGIDYEAAGEILFRNYVQFEKYRTLTSRLHSKEIDRIMELGRL